MTKFNSSLGKPQFELIPNHLDTKKYKAKIEMGISSDYFKFLYEVNAPNRFKSIDMIFNLLAHFKDLECKTKIRTSTTLC